MIRFLNYLPAAMGSKPLQSRLGIASGLHPLAERSMPATKRMPCDHEVVWECLRYIALLFMCVECSEGVIGSEPGRQRENDNSRKKVSLRLTRPTFVS